MKIKFSLIESYETSTNQYVLTFLIHEQDMIFRPNTVFRSSNGLTIDNRYYGYITNNTIYLSSANKEANEDRGFSTMATSLNFKDKENLVLFKNKIIFALKEWSNND